jgi:AmmeMemoRadiSam system protein A
MAYAHTLADDEKRELLRIARATLKEYLVSGRIPPGAPHRQSMRDTAGVFVSLHGAPPENKLRGCVGQVNDSLPLYKAIQEMAIAAASRDPRFPAVTTEELATTVIEISVLGERKRISGPDEIEVGKHGLQISVAGRKGLLLPQLARENGWNAATFLARLCEKAGVAEDAWKGEDAVIEAFAAQVFDEKAYPPHSAVVTIKT